MKCNPGNGSPATLCPGCGHWTDWQRNRDMHGKSLEGPGRRWITPHNCEVCHRVIKGAVNPEGRHVRDAPGQRTLKDGAE